MAESTTSCRVQIPKFYGYSTEDSTRFLEDFSAYCLLYNIKSSHRQVAALQLVLEGPAKIWFCSLPAAEKSNWTTVETLFRDKYPTTEGSALVANMEQFESLKLSCGDKLEVYFGQISDLGRKLQKSDMELMLKFVNSLPHQLAFYVRAGDPSSSRDALTKAKMGEAYGYRTSVVDNNSQSVLESRLEHVCNQVRTLQTMGQVERTLGTICQLCSQDGHSAQNCAERQGQCETCQLCNKAGHVAVDCRTRFGKRDAPKRPRARPLGRASLSDRRRSRPPSRSRKNFTKHPDPDPPIVNNVKHRNNFLYVPVQINCNIRLSALLDSGSAINLVSKDLYDQVPRKFKTNFKRCTEDIILANDQTVSVHGTDTIELKINDKLQCVDVYILENTSHPFILGSNYMRQNNIVLDFNKMSVGKGQSKICVTKKTVLDPNTETVVWGRLANYINTGVQGVCVGNVHISKKHLLAARSLATVSHDHLVPLKLMNPTDSTVTIYKNKSVGQFSAFDNSFQISPMSQLSSTGNRNQSASKHRLAAGNMCSNVNMKSHSKGTNREKQQFLSNFNLSNEHLSQIEKQELNSCLFANKDIFVTNESPDLGLTSVVEHQIHLKPGVMPKHQRPYKLPPDKREVLRHQLDELLKQGIITPVNEKEDIPISSPIVLVSKRNKPKPGVKPGSREASLSMYRFCADFRYLNSQTQDFCYAIPDVQELTESFTDRVPNYMSSIDLSSGFFQMKISPNSDKYTAVNTCFGTYKFKRLPMGLKTSPNSFQLLMDKVLHGLSFKSTLCYLDDVVIISESFQQHMTDLQEVFDRFRNAGLKLSPGKCKFAQRKCEFLGHEISKDGIRPPGDRLKAVENYPVPKNAKKLKQYLGMMNWFKKFIPNYSAVANCLYMLLRKNVKFCWGKEQQTAFETLRDSLLNSEALAFPRYDLPFVLSVDSCSRGIGYMLQQNHSKENGTETMRVVRFGSKSLSKWQQSYGPTKLELLGMVTSILDCASYLRGRKFVVECDHQALKPLFQKSLKGAIYERWLAILQEFDFEIRYKPAEQMVVADALSRCQPQSRSGSEFSSPDESDPFFPYVQEKATGDIRLPNGKTLQDIMCPQNSVSCDKTVNHVSHSQHRGHTLRSDSTDEYDADTEFDQLPDKRRPHSVPKSVLIRSTSEQTVPHETSHSDTVNSETASSQESSSFSEDIEHKIELFTKFDFSLEKTKELQEHDTQLVPIIQYLQDGLLPKSQKKARRILLESSDYAMIDGLLFHSRVPKSKRAKQLEHYQLVLPDTMVKSVLQLYHDTPMAGHAGISDTLDRVKEHYFFARMGPIVTDYVRSCPQCQMRKNTKHKTKSGITAYRTPSGPFQVLQIDLYGPLPVSNQGHSYVLTAVDMFSKYLVTIPLANKDTLSVASGLTKIFTTFGVCQTIISDLGTEFTSKCMKEICRQLNIQQEFTPSFAHHCLGACERTHRTLAERLTPYMHSSGQNWSSLLSSITFSINQSIHSTTGFSPHEVIFGNRPSFPLVASKPTDFDTIPVDVRAFVRQNVEKLNTIRQELRNNVIRSQDKMLDRANEQINPLRVSVGDFVYLQTDVTGAGQKLKSKYTGPFVIDKFCSPHLVTLRNSETGTLVKNPVHLDRLKMAYVREPQPTPYFLNKVVTGERNQPILNSDSSQHIPIQSDGNVQSQVQTDEQTIDYELPNLRRSHRERNAPDRFGINVNLDTLMSSEGEFIDYRGYHKLKRIIGQRPGEAGTEYLVQLKGEPSENAVWVHNSGLNHKAKCSVEKKPPPVMIIDRE